MINKSLTLLMLASLAHTGLAQAALPADVSAAPGLLFVNWHDAVSSNEAHPTLVIRNATGDVLKRVPAELQGMQQVRLPMRPSLRSLNLTNCASIAIYEAWRQLNFAGGK